MVFFKPLYKPPQFIFYIFRDLLIKANIKAVFSGFHTVTSEYSIYGIFIPANDNSKVNRHLTKWRLTLYMYLLILSNPYKLCHIYANNANIVSINYKTNAQT